MLQKHFVKNIICVFLCVSVVTVLFLFPEYCTKGIKNGIDICVEMLIPSLFPYMVLSSFMIRSGSMNGICRFFGKPFGRLTGLPPECLTAVLFSIIGGYPVGAKCVSLLFKDGIIDRIQSRRMMYYCVCSGPAFLLTAVGCLLIGSPTAGAILYFSQLISTFIVMIVVGYIQKNKQSEKTKQQISQRINNSGISESFVQSVNDGASAMTGMCSMVLLFSMLIGILEYSGAINYISGLLSGLGAPVWIHSLFYGLLEVSIGCKAVHDSTAPLWVYSAVVGFGGMCVHFQILSLTSAFRLEILRYLIARVINSVISSFISIILCELFFIAKPAMALPGGYDFEISSFSLIGSFVLILLCTVFTLGFRKKQ